MTERRYPELWTLRHMEGLSFGEIGCRTGLSRNVVQGRLYRMEAAAASPPPDVSPGLLRLAAFDPLARDLVRSRAPALLQENGTAP